MMQSGSGAGVCGRAAVLGGAPLYTHTDEEGLQLYVSSVAAEARFVNADRSPHKHSQYTDRQSSGKTFYTLNSRLRGGSTVIPRQMWAPGGAMPACGRPTRRYPLLVPAPRAASAHDRATVTPGQRPGSVPAAALACARQIRARLWRCEGALVSRRSRHWGRGIACLFHAGSAGLGAL